MSEVGAAKARLNVALWVSAAMKLAADVDQFNSFHAVRLNVCSHQNGSFACQPATDGNAAVYGRLIVKLAIPKAAFTFGLGQVPAFKD